MNDKHDHQERHELPTLAARNLRTLDPQAHARHTDPIGLALLELARLALADCIACEMSSSLAYPRDAGELLECVAAWARRDATIHALARYVIGGEDPRKTFATSYHLHDLSARHDMIDRWETMRDADAIEATAERAPGLSRLASEIVESVPRSAILDPADLLCSMP